jgi:HEAT repeat protein
MIGLSPEEIFKDFKKKKISKSKASELLISIIENSHEMNERVRSKCIRFIGLIGSKEKNVFLFLENLLISDLNELTRGNAATIIIQNFSDYALEPIKWALQHEQSETSLVLIIKALERINDLKLN